MIRSAKTIRCCTAYVGCAALALASGSRAVLSGQRLANGRVRRILVVEYRDEVFASVRRVLEDEGFVVGRADEAAAVADAVARFRPDLLLVNEAMHDESGWLITAKLRIGGQHHPVWLYTARQLRCAAQWQQLADVQQLLLYRGDLLQLLAQLRSQLQPLKSHASPGPARRSITVVSLVQDAA